MLRKYVERKLKTLGACLTVLLLLPYVVSVFAQGGLRGREQNVQYMILSKENEQGEYEECTLEWDDGLAAILAAQITDGMEEEAVKAQAVIVRTNAERMRENVGEDQGEAAGMGELPRLEEDYLTRKELEKKWGISEAERYYEKCRSAVEDTEAITGKYNGELAWLPYHRSNNGKTRMAADVFGEGEFPYLQAVDCPGDLQSESALRTETFTYEEVQSLCRGFLVAETTEEQAEAGYDADDFEILEYDQAGYVKKMRIGQTECTGDQFRDALQLASGAFSFSCSGDTLKITTTGKGHGLGLSQWTANEMAKEGKTFREIVSYFFADVTFG